MQFPELTNIKRLGLDSETTGLDRHGADMPIGVSIAYQKRPDNPEDYGSHYFAFGHAHGGNNCSQEGFRSWASSELMDKEVSLINPSFDLHMLQKIGLNMEPMGVKPRGVQYRCALLDEYRRKYDLNSMAKDYLGAEKHALDKFPFELPGDIVAPYAKRDAELTARLDAHFAPMIYAQGLSRVAALEDELIWPVLFMECQGVYLDIPKLIKWESEVALELQHLQETILEGVNVKSGKQLAKVFDHMGVSYERTDTGRPSFDEAAVEELRIRNFERPEVVAFCDQIMTLRSMRTLHSSYLKKYLEESQDGKLFYNLHQCRSSDGGTVSGRFSSSHVNIQQVASEDNLAEPLRQWVIRELFLPESGCSWLSADASQIEFRLFAHYSKSARLINAYRLNPKTDFHEAVSEMSGLKRKWAKNLNFAQVYGAGELKTAIMLGCGLEQAQAFRAKYREDFPEAASLFGRAMIYARNKGCVKTILGRRARFPGKQRLHSALNRIIQGTAADIMKQKLIEIYRAMDDLEFTMKFTVHDEVDGDLRNPDNTGKLKELLDSPSFDLRVPILWDVKTGQNWRLKDVS